MILMGGNAEAIWAMSPRCRVAQNCREMAVEMGFQKPSDGLKWTKEDNQALLQFFKSQAAERLGLTVVFRRFMIEPVQLQLTPILDGDLFPRNLSELRDEAPKKRIIVGETEFESLLFCKLI